MGKEQLEQLQKNGVFLSVPHGDSMRPMIRSMRDVLEVSALTREPKRRDLVYYQRPDGQGVLHRVLKVEKNRFYIVGDNCWQIETVLREHIQGIVLRFCRKGKWHSTEELGYRLYVRLWTDLFFLRRPILYFRDRRKHK